LNVQTIDFSRTGAHHQNGIAEQNIKTVVEWAQVMVLHSAIHWPDMVVWYQKGEKSAESLQFCEHFLAKTCALAILVW
jgi:hypothetical protein